MKGLYISCSFVLVSILLFMFFPKEHFFSNNKASLDAEQSRARLNSEPLEYRLDHVFAKTLDINGSDFENLDTMKDSEDQNAESKQELIANYLSQLSKFLVIKSEAQLSYVNERKDALIAHLLKYSRIYIYNNFRVSNTVILEAAGLENSPYFWTKSLSEINEKIGRLPWVEKVDTKIGVFPLRLDISIQEAQPWIVAEYQGQSWLVSSSGVLVEPLELISDANLVIETSELPRLDGLDSQISFDTFLSSANGRFLYAIKSLRFLEMAGDFPWTLERITLLSYGALSLKPVEFAEFPEVILTCSSLEEASESLSFLKIVTEDLKQRGEKIGRIDLRFKNRAVVS